MCGRITVITQQELQEIIADLQAGKHAGRLGNASESGSTRAQARPGSPVNAITSDKGVLSSNVLNWGFKPSWSNKLVFNTRIESALKGGMWRDAIREGRCILPAATFFETHQSETIASPRTGRPIKRPYEFALPNAEPLLLASICEQGQLSVVTTQPNAAVAPIHPRMPLVLRFEEVPLWMEGELDDIAQLALRDDIDLTCTAEPLPSRMNKKAEDGGSSQLSLF